VWKLLNKSKFRVRQGCFGASHISAASGLERFAKFVRQIEGKVPNIIPLLTGQDDHDFTFVVAPKEPLDAIREKVQ
jgi:hypothetical protein